MISLLFLQEPVAITVIIIQVPLHRLSHSPSLTRRRSPASSAREVLREVDG